MNIPTERLILIPVSEAHTEDIYQNFNEKIIAYMFPSLPKHIDETREVVRMFITQRENRTDYIYAINLKGSGEFIGLAGLHCLGSSVPELGIWTKFESHGSYYGREATGGLISYARTLGLKSLYYPVDRRNIPSKKIALFYGGVLVSDFRQINTADGRVLEEEIYEISLQ